MVQFFVVVFYILKIIAVENRWMDFQISSLFKPCLKNRHHDTTYLIINGPRIHISKIKFSEFEMNSESKSLPRVNDQFLHID